MSDHKNNSSLNQEEALESYFDDLLMTSGEVTVAPPKNNPLKLVHSSATAIENVLQSAEEVEPEPAKIQQQSNLPAKDERLEKVREYEVKASTPIVSDEIKVNNKINKDDGRPVWAGDSFEAMIFVVKQMKFAIPVSAIKASQPISSALKKMPNQPEWVMGLDCSGASFTALVDTSLLLLNQASKDYQQQILLAESQWGLAVDKILNNVHITSEDVNWRAEATTRQWLSGLEPKQQLAIIEPSHIFTKDQ